MTGKMLPKRFIVILALGLILLLVSGTILISNGQEKAMAMTMASSGSAANSKQDIQISVSDNPSQDIIGFSSQIIEITNDVGQNYFVNYRIKREQFRQETKDMLKPLLESDIRKTREEAQLRWLALSNKISKEGEIENVLKMRGFRDVVSEVNGGKVTVTILAPEIKSQEINHIKQIAADITGFRREKVEIALRT